MPPFVGPRASLCFTRYPVKAWTRPSSRITGTETSTARLHCSSTVRTPSGTSNSVATRRSCILATSSGFSRRWDACVTVAIALNLLDGEAHPRAAERRTRRQHRPRHEPQLIPTGREPRRVRPAARDREPVPAGQEVTLAREHPEEPARRVVQ